MTTETPTPTTSPPDEGGTSERDHRREAQDEILVESIAAGLSYPDAGAAAGVTARTVGRRMTDPAFLSRVSQRRGERVSEITGRLSSMSADALGVLRDTMVEGRPADRLRAAQLTLTMLSRFRAESEIEERLAVIEGQLAGTRRGEVA